MYHWPTVPTYIQEKEALADKEKDKKEDKEEKTADSIKDGKPAEKDKTN